MVSKSINFTCLLLFTHLSSAPKAARLDLSLYRFASEIYQPHLPTSRSVVQLLVYKSIYPSSQHLDIAAIYSSNTLHSTFHLNYTHPNTINMFTTAILLFTSLLPTLITAADVPKSRTVNPNLNAALRMAATNFDRQALLPADTDWYFDFDSSPNWDSASGAVINADAASFPALTGLGSSIALLKLAPCGMLPPHLHPRATNLVTAITGNTTSYMIGENGVKTRKVDLIPMRVTIFPQGSLHTMQNNGMSPPFLPVPAIYYRTGDVAPSLRL
jgi:hypothetical protein